MKVVIKNLHVIQSLLETNPELLFEINLKKSNADKFSAVKGIAEKNRNLGSCLRSASFFGAQSIIIPKTNSADYANPAVIETSTGGVYDLNLYKVSNISQTIEQLKQRGYWISGFSEHSSDYAATTKFTEKNVLVFGNEEKGIRQLVQKNCDQILKIRQLGQTSSLNVSVAAAIGLYEATKS